MQMNNEEKKFLLECLEKLEFQGFVLACGDAAVSSSATPVSELSLFHPSRGFVPLSLEGKLIISALCKLSGRSLTLLEVDFFTKFSSPVFSFIQSFSLEDKDIAFSLEDTKRYISIFEKISSGNEFLQKTIDGKRLSVEQTHRDIDAIIKCLVRRKYKLETMAVVSCYEGCFNSFVPVPPAEQGETHTSGGTDTQVNRASRSRTPDMADVADMELKDCELNGDRENVRKRVLSGGVPREGAAKKTRPGPDSSTNAVSGSVLLPPSGTFVKGRGWFF